MTQDSPEIKIVETEKVVCDGDQGALGHPRVYMSMNKEGMTECSYCDRRFILKGGPSDNAGK